jgi:hypothetical protein
MTDILVATVLSASCNRVSVIRAIDMNSHLVHSSFVHFLQSPDSSGTSFGFHCSFLLLIGSSTISFGPGSPALCCTGRVYCARLIEALVCCEGASFYGRSALRIILPSNTLRNLASVALHPVARAFAALKRLGVSRNMPILVSYCFSTCE